MRSERIDMPGMHGLFRGLLLLGSCTAALLVLVIVQDRQLPLGMALVPIALVTLLNVTVPAWRARSVRVVPEGLAVGDGRRARLVPWDAIVSLSSMMVELAFCVQPRELRLRDGSVVVFFSDNHRYRHLQRLIDLHF